MRVTIVVGGRFHAFDLAAELHRLGSLHRLVTNYPRFVALRWGIPADRVVSLPTTGILSRVISRMSAKAVSRSQYRLHRWFSESAARHLEGTDVLVGWSSFAEPSIAWAKERGIPTCLERGSAHITEQGGLLGCEYESLGIPWCGIDRNIEHMELREYGMCDRVCVPSLFVERTFLARGFAAERLHRNMYGVNLAQFRPTVTPPPPSPERLLAVYAGSMSVRKGTTYLLRAFESVRRPAWRLSLIGSVTSEARPWVFPAPEGVEVLGVKPQGQLPGLYSGAHCFVMPSIEEGMAMVQLQALACGLPLICTANTGGEDLLRLSGNGVLRASDVTEFPAGYLVPIRRPDSIAWCLHDLANSPETWRSKRESGLQIARSSLGWSQYAERSLAMYSQLARPESSPIST